VIFAEDLRKPALSSQHCVSYEQARAMYVELRLLHILQEDGHRVLSRLAMINIAYAVRGQIGLAMLVLWYLELAMCELLAAAIGWTGGCVPLIEPHGILDEQQSLLRQERRAQCGCEIELVQEHSDHQRVCNIHRYLFSGASIHPQADLSSLQGWRYQLDRLELERSRALAEDCQAVVDHLIRACRRFTLTYTPRLLLSSIPPAHAPARRSALNL
jgi:hypothetical protein